MLFSWCGFNRGFALAMVNLIGIADRHNSASVAQHQMGNCIQRFQAINFQWISVSFVRPRINYFGRKWQVFQNVENSDLSREKSGQISDALCKMSQWIAPIWVMCGCMIVPGWSWLRYHIKKSCRCGSGLGSNAATEPSALGKHASPTSVFKGFITMDDAWWQLTSSPLQYLVWFGIILARRLLGPLLFVRNLRTIIN